MRHASLRCGGRRLGAARPVRGASSAGARCHRIGYPGPSSHADAISTPTGQAGAMETDGRERSCSYAPGPFPRAL
ncbi:hypothetical protein PCLA_12f0241 [Pseudomonas citronellolis]|nr:hypothetical protein PCLA_12f0241 [Pseudomonas citronellolis]